MSRSEHLHRFYDLLAQLEQKLAAKWVLCDCDAKREWAARGVYFFFEPGEYRQSAPEQLRVVRVGTHAVSEGAKSTLWQRLKQHKGNKEGGHHRGSVFRRHVGMAIIRRDELSMPSWNQDTKDRLLEKSLEKQVSAYIQSLPFLWVAVPDEPSKFSHRSTIEKNSIILLAGEDGRSPIDLPSPQWLGHYSDRERIQHSGLWNVNYVGDVDKPESYNPGFLDILEHYVKQMP